MELTFWPASAGQMVVWSDADGHDLESKPLVGWIALEGDILPAVFNGKQAVPVLEDDVIVTIKNS